MNRKKAYYDLFEDKKECVITHKHIFEAIKAYSSVYNIFKMNVIDLKSPLLVIVSGSSFKENVCVLNNEILLPRDNCEDKIIIIDIDSEVLIRHKKYIKGMLPGVNISLKLGDMNKLPFKKDSVDLLINDCAINFNRFSYQNNKTISEIARVLKHNSGICFFLAV